MPQLAGTTCDKDALVRAVLESAGGDERVQGGKGREGQGRGLLEREVVGFLDQEVLGDGDVLGEAALTRLAGVLGGDESKYGVADLEAGPFEVAVDDGSGDIRLGYSGDLLEEVDGPGFDHFPVDGVQGDGVHLDEDSTGLCGRLRVVGLEAEGVLDVGLFADDPGAHLGLLACVRVL